MRWGRCWRRGRHDGVRSLALQHEATKGTKEHEAPHPNCFFRGWVAWPSFVCFVPSCCRAAGARAGRRAGGPHDEITLEKGRVTQSNFHDYRMLRINEAPEIVVHLVPSTEYPGGMGEPGTSAVAPAVTSEGST